MKSHEISIPVGKLIKLKADFKVPSDAASLVIFSHGGGSSSFSPRNNHAAKILNQQNIATLMVDLLTEIEDINQQNHFDIELLTDRLLTVTSYARQYPGLKERPIGFFGASTGAASALNAAAQLTGGIQAIVTRDGRPDLASNIGGVKAPTLLIVGGLDREVIKLNAKAYDLLNCENQMEVIDGASHLFEEPGKLNEMSALASAWFKKHLSIKNHHHENI